MSNHSPSKVFAPLYRHNRRSTSAAGMAAENRDAAIREAKQYVREVVRNDWEYEAPPGLFAATGEHDQDRERQNQEYEGQIDGASSTSAVVTTDAPPAPAATTRETPKEVAGWRLRELGDSDTDWEPVDVEGSSAHPEKGRKTSKQERRRRQRAILEEEMSWNPGLRFFIERRDAWTGARKRREIEIPPKSGQAASAESQQDTEGAQEKKQSSTSQQAPTEHLRDLSLMENSESLSPSNDPSAEQDISIAASVYDADPEDPVVPIMRPFLPATHPVRQAITPSLYQSIYSRVVVQGLTPSIPINLADMTRAIVAGWKADGNWPPKPTPADMQTSSVMARRTAAAAASQNHHHHQLGNKLRKSSFGSHDGGGVTGAVKKVLNMSAHGFQHLRRASRGHNNPPSAATGDNADTATKVVDETAQVPVSEEGKS